MMKWNAKYKKVLQELHRSFNRIAKTLVSDVITSPPPAKVELLAQKPPKFLSCTQTETRGYNQPNTAALKA
jgi:hypothetical protein